MKKIIIFLLLTPVFSFADPSATTRYLMNDNVSMLEFGLFRMDYDLKNDALPALISQNADIASQEDFAIRIGAGYNWDDDLITVLITISPGTRDAERRCKTAIEGVSGHVWAGVNYFWFKHLVFAPKSEPANLSDQLTERTELRCQMNIEAGQSVLVRQKLGSKLFSVTQSGQR